MAYRLLILQHDYRQRERRLVQRLASKYSLHLNVVDLFHYPVPDIAHFDALIVFGMPIIRERRALLQKEVRQVLQAWISLDRPCLCMGAGSLLLADVMGATIGPNFVSSIGFTTGYLTHDGRMHPLFAGFDLSFPLFKWHDQSVLTPLPRSMLLLATSRECVVEAFCGRDRHHIIGIQSELYNVHQLDFSALVTNELAWQNTTREGDGDISLHVDNAKRYSKEIRARFLLLLENFVSLL